LGGKWKKCHCLPLSKKTETTNYSKTMDLFNIPETKKRNRIRTDKLNIRESDDKLLEWVNEFLDYDRDSGVFTWRKNLGKHSHLVGQKAGSKTALGYIDISVRNKPIRAHKIAWLVVYGCLPEIIDHINRDKTDNRISNLRIASKSQNARNRSLQKKKNNLPMGVTYYKNNRWQARIMGPNKKRLHLGMFGCPIIAGEAYKKAQKEICGEFAPI